MKCLPAGKASALHRGLQLLRTYLQHSRKLPLLGLDNFGNSICLFLQLRIRTLHFVADGEDHVAHEGLVLAEQASVADTTAENLAQDVAAAFVCGQHAVGNQESSAARVVGDDAKRSVRWRRSILIYGFGQLSGARNQRSEQVRLEV